LLPVFGWTSYASLFFFRDSAFLELIRQVYEAMVLHWFVALIIELLGGWQEAIVRLQSPVNPESKILAVPPLCWLFWPCDKPRRLDERLLKWAWYSLTQFCVLRPITALIAVILIMGSSNYQDGIMSPSSGYLPLELVNAASMLWALWFLFIIYKGTLSLLSEHKTTAKFACIKLGLFVSTLQKGTISLFFMDGMSDDHFMPKAVKAAAWNNFLLTVEMMLLSFLYRRAFPIPTIDDEVEESILGGSDSSDSSARGSATDDLHSKLVQPTKHMTPEEERELEREREHDAQVFSVSALTFGPPISSSVFGAPRNRQRSSSTSHVSTAPPSGSGDVDISYQNSRNQYGTV